MRDAWTDSGLMRSFCVKMPFTGRSTSPRPAAAEILMRRQVIKDGGTDEKSTKGRKTSGRESNEDI